MTPTTLLPFPPSFCCSSRVGLHRARGPPTCGSIFLYWERCLLYPQLKVGKHPANNAVWSPAGKWLTGSVLAGLGAVQKTGTCRWCGRSSRPQCYHWAPRATLSRDGQVQHCSLASLHPKGTSTLPSPLRLAHAQQQEAHGSGCRQCGRPVRGPGPGTRRCPKTLAEVSISSYRSHI